MGLTAAERQRRSRAHRRGDHSLCDPERCPDVTPAVTQVTDPVVTVPVTDPVLLDLGRRGRRLYTEVLAEHPTLGPRQRLVLEEAARSADRLEKLDRILRGEDTAWARIEIHEHLRELVVDKTLAEARQQQTTLRGLLAELRQSLTPPASEKDQPAKPGQESGGGGKILDLAAAIQAKLAGAAR